VLKGENPDYICATAVHVSMCGCSCRDTQEWIAFLQYVVLHKSSNMVFHHNRLATGLSRLLATHTYTVMTLPLNLKDNTPVYMHVPSILDCVVKRG